MPKLSLISNAPAQPTSIEQAITALQLDLHGLEAGGAIPTGFPYLDSFITGLHQGQLTVLAARPGVGKSTFASHVILNAAGLGRGPVLVFTLGMAQSQLALRLICMEATVSSHTLRHGELSSEEIDRIERAKDRVSKLNLFIDDTPALSIPELSERIRAFSTSNTDACLVAVDNIHEVVAGVTPINRGGNSGIVAQALKRDATALDLPILATVSLKRSLEQRADKRPRLTDLHSVEVARAADVLLFLYAEELYDPDTSEKGLAEIAILRNRHGGGAMIRLHRDPACFSFSSYDYGDGWVV